MKNLITPTPGPAVPWFCPTCDRGIGADSVTQDHHHNPMMDGCGEPVGKLQMPSGPVAYGLFICKEGRWSVHSTASMSLLGARIEATRLPAGMQFEIRPLIDGPASDINYCARIEELESQLVKGAAAPDLGDIEQYRMQMAAIGVASLGYWKEGDSIHSEYDTVTLHDVARLYAKYEALAAPTVQAPVQTAAEIRSQALEEAAIECERMVMFPGGRCEAPAHNSVWDAASAIRALAGQQVAQGEKGGELQAVTAFLMGETELEGVVFGDRHPTKAGAFWWRHNLRAAIHAAGLRPERKG